MMENQEDNFDYEKDEQFYTKAQEYWSKVDATVDGMLGGFAAISRTELVSSRLFLNEIYRVKPAPERVRALDCGAGIGRVSKGLLMPFFLKTDLVEQDEAFCNTARTHLKDDPRLGDIYNCGLQDFDFGEDKYDVIWTQWVLGHLKDSDLIDFWIRAQKALKKNGIIVMKENFTSGDEIEVDQEDSSVTRPLKVAKKLIAKAGLRIIKAQKQSNMPEGLFPIHTLAMKPNKKSSSTGGCDG